MTTRHRSWWLAVAGLGLWWVTVATGGHAQEPATAPPSGSIGLSAAGAGRHAARFNSSEACIVARMERAGGPAPSGATALGGQLVAGLDLMPGEPVAEVEGRVVAVESRLTTDRSRVFTVYRLAVDAVVAHDVRVPVAPGQMIVVSRPGGRVVLGARTADVLVAGFRPVDVGIRWRPLLVAADGGEGYHEVRRPMPGVWGGAR